jgi:electron transfer flavoprotein alpha subunit
MDGGRISMEKILVLTHLDETGAALSKGSLETVAAGQELATKLGSTLTIGILGDQTAEAANALAATGARLLAVSGADFAQARYASDAAAVEALAKTAEATIVLAPQDSRLARVAAGVAYRLKGAIDTHITALNGLEVGRSFYRQRVEAVIAREGQRPWFLLIDPGVFKAYDGGAGGASSAEAVTVNLPALRTTVAGFRAPSAGEQTIRPEAKLLFVAGAGWTKKQPDGQVKVEEAGKLILGFLGQTKASLGSSKSLVDQGGEGNSVLPFLTHLNQVGQTGSTPRHPKGLATCCHGEEPHVVGWRFINDRRAISLDPNCGWTRGKADVVYIADAFQVIAKVNELLAK